MSEARFAIVPSDAVTDQELTATQLRVLLVIGTYLSKDDRAFPKQKTIADRLGIARETVNRAVKVLSDKEYIQVHHQKRDDGGQRANQYTVKLDPCDRSVTPPVISKDHTPCDHTGSHPRTPQENASCSDEQDLVRDAPTPPKANPKKPKKGSQIPDGWMPSETDYAFAQKKGLSPQEITHESEKFIAHHTAKGTLSKSWAASWRTWCLNASKWKAERSSQGRSVGGPRSSGNAAFDLLDQLYEVPQGADEPRGFQADDSFVYDAEEVGGNWR
jgi:hypothetical protein